MVSKTTCVLHFNEELLPDGLKKVPLQLVVSWSDGSDLHRITDSPQQLVKRSILLQDEPLNRGVWQRKLVFKSLPSGLTMTCSVFPENENIKCNKFSLISVQIFYL